MKGTNQKGITLIALIVTIIVLVIIAGISIAVLTSDNGILKQTNAAKVDQIEGTAREQVKLAVASLRLAIAEASSQDNSYKANENAGLIQAKLKEILNKDKTGLNGEFDFGGNQVTGASNEITINYTGNDYQNACNDENADIVYTITLGQKLIELKYETNATLKDEKQNDTIIDVGGNTIEKAGEYLVDKVEIGDYVDIGIDYTNQGTFYPDYVSNTYSSTGMTGWRVLSKSGSGETGTVTLVSAGTPLVYYHKVGQSSTSITNLSNLNKVLPQGSSSSIGYTASGFENGTFNLASIWATNSKINASTAHAMTTNEIEAAYAELTETSKTMSQLYSMTYPLIISNMTSVNSSMSTKAYDLLGNGFTYWLGGLSHSTSELWYVSYYGYVDYERGGTQGVRPVVTLNSGVQIAGDNTGTNETSAYKLVD